MKAIERLVDKVTAVEIGLLPDEWRRDANAALAEAIGTWMAEPAFRMRTGASADWCRKHFERYAENGLARRDGKKREWHIHARLPLLRQPASDLEQHIVDTYRKVSA